MPRLQAPKPEPELARPAPAVPCASPPPVSAVVPLPSKAVAIAAHAAQACALLDTGRAVCWGHNERDQLRLAASDGAIPVVNCRR